MSPTLDAISSLFNYAVACSRIVRSLIYYKEKSELMINIGMLLGFVRGWNKRGK
jgi:hypothetical protein